MPTPLPCTAAIADTSQPLILSEILIGPFGEVLVDVLNHYEIDELPQNWTLTRINRLFTGLFPAGIVYADKTQEEYGDYKKVAFLPYDNLKLEFYDCPKELRKIIENDAKQYKKGDKLMVSCSQSIILGKEI